MILSLTMFLAVIAPVEETVQSPESFSATITAYSELETCPNNPCITASGTVGSLQSAACPRDIPFHTQIDVDGVRYVCEDRTHIRHNGRYDLFMGYGQHGYTKAREYGKRIGTVIIID